jgi:adenosylcobinamide-GDP ribazoletransferase
VLNHPREETRLSCHIKRFCTALRFLTLLPVSWHAAEDHRHFRASLPYFPLVGLVLGLAAFLLSKILLLILPVPVVAALALIILVGASGGLHLDGLADSADGLLSARPRIEALQIMKDSRVGAMGLIAVVTLLLAKFAALSSLPADRLPQVLLIIPAVGRGALLLLMARLDYVGGEGGVGQLFYERSAKKLFLFGWLLLAVIGAFFSPRIVLPALVGMLLITLFFAKWCRRRLGGATGDTLGAGCELAETAAAMCCSVTFL